MCEALLPDELNTFYPHCVLHKIHSHKVYSASRGPATVSYNSRCKNNPTESEHKKGCWSR